MSTSLSVREEKARRREVEFKTIWHFIDIMLWQVNLVAQWKNGKGEGGLLLYHQRIKTKLGRCLKSSEGPGSRRVPVVCLGKNCKRTFILVVSHAIILWRPPDGPDYAGAQFGLWNIILASSQMAELVWSNPGHNHSGWILNLPSWKLYCAASLYHENWFVVLKRRSHPARKIKMPPAQNTLSRNRTCFYLIRAKNKVSINTLWSY